MDVSIERRRMWTYVHAGANRDWIYKKLDTVLSYPIPGAIYSEKYTSGVWDGRARLHSRPRGRDAVKFPTGMLDLVVPRLAEIGCNISPHDATRRFVPSSAPLGTWIGYNLRPYQEEAVQAVFRAVEGAIHDPFEPPGAILNLPVRSGKTLIGAAIAQLFGMPLVFVVPTKILVDQTVEVFKKSIEGITVGTFRGGSKDTTSDVIVATIQSLAAGPGTEDFKRLKQQNRILILDEAHHGHGDAKKWRNGVIAMNPRLCIGLSATLKMDDFTDPEAAESTRWVRGVCGPIRYTVPIDELIELGHLVPPTIEWREVGAPKMPKKKRTGTQLYSEGISKSEERNAAVVQAAIDHVEAGRRVLVDTERVGQAREINRDLKKHLGSGRVGLIIGATKDGMRKKLLDAFVRGDIVCMVGNVIGEGVDIPLLDTVVNAEGGRGYVPVMQRFRCMTPAPGKKTAYMVDFIDSHHDKLMDATIERMRVYTEIKNATHVHVTDK